MKKECEHSKSTARSNTGVLLAVILIIGAGLILLNPFVAMSQLVDKATARALLEDHS